MSNQQATKPGNDRGGFVADAWVIIEFAPGWRLMGSGEGIGIKRVPGTRRFVNRQDWFNNRTEAVLVRTSTGWRFGGIPVTVRFLDGKWGRSGTKEIPDPFK